MLSSPPALPFSSPACTQCLAVVASNFPQRHSLVLVTGMEMAVLTIDTRLRYCMLPSVRTWPSRIQRWDEFYFAGRAIFSCTRAIDPLRILSWIYDSQRCPTRLEKQRVNSGRGGTSCGTNSQSGATPFLKTTNDLSVPIQSHCARCPYLRRVWHGEMLLSTSVS